MTMKDDPEHGGYVIKYPPYYKWSIIEFAETQKNFMSMMLDGSFDGIDFVGITERFVESVHKFIKYFNLEIEPCDDYGHRYLSTEKRFVSEEERIVIKEMNKDDYELYDEALSKFDSLIL